VFFFYASVGCIFCVCGFFYAHVVVIVHMQARQKNQSAAEPTAPPPLSREQFNARVVQETFRRFNNIPWVEREWLGAKVSGEEGNVIYCLRCNKACSTPKAKIPFLIFFQPIPN